MCPVALEPSISPEVSETRASGVIGAVPAARVVAFGLGHSVASGPTIERSLGTVTAQSGSNG